MLIEKQRLGIMNMEKSFVGKQERPIRVGRDNLWCIFLGQVLVVHNTLGSHRSNDRWSGGSYHQNGFRVE